MVPLPSFGRPWRFCGEKGCFFVWKKRALPALAALLFLCLALQLRTMDSGDILARAPQRPLPTALFLLGLYALKGLTFFLPLAALEAAGGLLFPPWTAVAVNLLGVITATTLPFWVGRTRQGSLNSLMERYPRLRVLRQRKNRALLIFLVRLGGVLPCDGVSFYFGAAGVPFPVYLLAGTGGMLPHVAAVTLLGSSVGNPGSPAFLTAAGFSAAVTVAALSVWKIQTFTER